MAEGIIQYSKEIIDDLKITTNTTYSSDKIEKLLASIPNGNTTEVILGCFDSTNVPTTFVQDDQYYNTTDGKIYKATSSTVWDAGTAPKEDVLYASIADNKIYAYIKNVWGVYGGNTTKISAKTNNIVSDLQGQTNANENGLHVPLSKKSGNVIDNLTGQATDVNNGLFVGKSAKTDNALQKITGSTNSSEDGLYVEDLNPKINRLDLTAKLNKYGTQEYFMLGGLKNSTETPNISLSTGAIYDLLYLMRNEKLNTTIDDTTRFNFSTNGTTNTTGSYVVLKAGITYSIELMILGSNSGSYYVFDENSKQLGNRGFTGASNYSDTGVNTIVKFDKDTKIYFKYKPDIASALYSGCSYIKIESMEYLAIDPLQYVDNTNGTQDTPVGTIINVMGKTAPKHYLICDGTEYQIKDYPYLTQYFKEQFGSVSHFGGDGATTFKVPDLRGEFLRGTGTNSHEATNIPTAGRSTSKLYEGSGSPVGEHQPSTYMSKVYNYSNANRVGLVAETIGYNNPNIHVGYDTNYIANGVRYVDIGFNTGNVRPNNVVQGGTIKPTNTSVLYCIKAEPTYFINVIGTTTETELLDTAENISIPTNSDLVTVLNQDVQLSDEITNFDKIKIKIGLDTGTGTSNRDTREIDVSDISYTSAIGDDAYTMFMTVVAGSGIHTVNILFSFKDSQTLTIIRSGYYCSGTKSWTGLKLLSVKGIKTTSVVQGGNFGGSGSSNPDCDCGTLTPTQIATAITDSGTELDK